MSLDLEGDDLSKFILVGDRVLVKPKTHLKKQNQDYTYHRVLR